MEKLVNIMVMVFASFIYSSAIAGASTASHMGLYQSKTPKSLINQLLIDRQ